MFVFQGRCRWFKVCELFIISSQIYRSLHLVHWSSLTLVYSHKRIKACCKHVADLVSNPTNICASNETGKLCLESWSSISNQVTAQLLLSLVTTTANRIIDYTAIICDAINQNESEVEKCGF